MCQHGRGYDDPLPIERRPEWENWIGDIQNVPNVKIPRCLKPNNLGDSIIELHHFSDASTSGYGQCSYTRYINDDSIHCSLLIAKARVAPKKVVTIPRLELTAAVISVKVSTFLNEELDLKIDREYFWTDSQVVLRYINNDARRFHVFVANHVQIIRDTTTPDQWFYVKTENSPADHAPRGLSVCEITNSNWLTGPTFLWQREIETNEIIKELQIGDEEVKKAKTLKTDTEPLITFDLLERLRRFSSWRLSVSVVARILRLCNGVKRSQPLSVEERQPAEITILTLIQTDAYNECIIALQKSKRTNCLYPLDPFLHNGL